jgi:AraC family transcriptional regulator, positive regulator of tynA and feaB
MATTGRMHLSPHSPPLMQWSTSAVAQDHRLDYWVGAICEAFLEMDCSSTQANSFSGSLTCLPTPTHNLNLNQVRAAPQDVYRTRQAISRSKQAPFYLITDAMHDWHVEQDAQTARVRVGDSVLVDSASPYALHFRSDVNVLSVQIPRDWLGQWLVEPECKGVRCIRKEDGWGRSLSVLGQQLATDLDSARAWPLELLTDHIGALLGAALNPKIAEKHLQLHADPTDLIELAEQVIRSKLSSPLLTAAYVAHEVGVSIRTLHRACAKKGTTFLHILQTLRVQRARAMLCQASLSGVQVGEIGRRCGFADPSHFNRVFQQHMRQTPAQWRNVALYR